MTGTAGGLPRRSKLALGFVCAASVAGLYLMLASPPFERWPFVATSMLTVHLLLELGAVIVAMMIVTASWHAFESERHCGGGVLIAGFVVVGGSDLVHALTYAGMPPLLNEASTPRAIFFWLTGRTAEAATLAALALAPAWRPPRAAAMAAGLGTLGLVLWLGAERLDAFPATFVPGVGVTPFKARWEYALALANASIAVVLWWRARGRAVPALMGTSAFVMAVGGLAFTHYVTPSDFQNIFGHLYKVVAYVLLYHATYVVSLRAPYAALRASQARAWESEQRVRSLGDNLPGCVVYQLVREADGRVHFSYMSEAVLAVNGVRAEDALRDPRTIYDLVVPEDRAGLNLSREDSARTMGLVDHVVRVRRPDGMLRWMHLFARPRPLGEGRIAWDGVQLDITERKLDEDERRRLEAQLREAQKTEAIGTLAGGIAHDFNNVLGAIVGNLALARGDLEAGRREPALRNLEQVERAARRARELVRKIVAFSRRRPPELRRVALRPIVEDCIALLRATIPANVNFVTHLTERPAWAMADAGELQQAVVNLATNAWQALEDRPGTIEVALDVVRLDAGDPSALPPGEYVRLGVRDDGCGMDDETKQRIFEPFFTTKLQSGGTGLGLSVVHGIVRGHGGAVLVDSAPGRGTRFDVYLPAAAAPEGDAALMPAAPPPRRGHVLYVDDDEVMGLMVERLLAREGHEVTVFRAPEEALQALAAAPGRFQVLVTDFSMPGLSGLDVARQARTLAPALPVVVTSGYVSDELESRAAACGVRRLVRKEYTLEELPAAVAEALASRPATVGAASA